MMFDLLFNENLALKQFQLKIKPLGFKINPKLISV